MLFSFFFVSAMYDNFLEKGHSISYEFYRRVFENENIAFATYSSDECTECLNYENHKKESKNSDHDANSCETCVKSESHLAKASIARELYREDMKQANCCCVDMQKVIILPKLTSKEHFFTSRLVYRTCTSFTL